MNNLKHEWLRYESRRQFLGRGVNAVGWAALASLLGADKALRADSTTSSSPSDFAGAVRPHHTPKARQVIYLHMVGGPPQMDLYDYKPVMGEWYDKDLPDTVRMGQRLTTMTSGQSRF